eukprot:TRINITY_DN16819_c0_g1_i4.p1 TRINITY_DN16819_c0_g1~~TRINITY_DN16819_c0_g1_i4.p1  ORF type:complete len:206 (+),score=46.43 TRINITY_DN16819_c0_g1_i4:94-711(+)
MGYDHHTEVYVTKKARKEKVLQLIEKGQWEAVLQEYENNDEYREPLLLWIRPTMACLTFIEEQMNKLGLRSISSVGCGCGTLEWLIQAGTGVSVTGYEVNRIWWEGAHSTPHYIDMEYLDEVEGKTCLIPANTALMFCYFNHLPYFHKYLQEYKGSCVILIGPIDGERHCEPEPGYLMGHKDWVIMGTMSIRGEDEISVYTRRAN